MARSTVLVGATTMNAILCLAANTAALYVPIYHRWRLGWMRCGNGQDWDVYLVRGVTVPRDAIGADNCNECMKTRVPARARRDLDEWERTNSMDGFVLEKRADHGVTDHGGRDGERVELQGSQSTYASEFIGEGFDGRIVTEILGDMGLFECNTPSRGVPVRVSM